MNLVLLEPDEIGPDGGALLRGRRAAHVRGTLNARPGMVLRVGVTGGPLGAAQVVRATEREVSLRCRLETNPPPVPPVDLLLALPRPKVLKRLWAPLASMGVGRIILTTAWKVDKAYFATHVLSERVYRPLLVEGLEQAGNTRLPLVSVHRRFKVLVEDQLDRLCPHGARLLAEAGVGPGIPAALGRAGRPARVLLAIGPEGGWTAYERGLLHAHGFQSVSAGPRTLRTDTACVVTLGLVHDALQSPPAGI